MATGPLETDPTAALQAERDALARRCLEAERRIKELTEELAAARAEVAALEQHEADSLSLFDGGTSSGDRLTGDGSDPRVLSLVLGATAVVAAMVTLLALINGNLFSAFGVVMIVITIGLAWGAASTRVVPVEVSVARGMVYIEQGESSYRFDLRRSETRVEMVGRPGDANWAVHFPRRGMDPFVVTGSMVDAEEFTRQLREYRPDL